MESVRIAPFPDQDGLRRVDRIAAGLTGMVLRSRPGTQLANNPADTPARAYFESGNGYAIVRKVDGTAGTIDMVALCRPIRSEDIAGEGSDDGVDPGADAASAPAPCRPHTAPDECVACLRVEPWQVKPVRGPGDADEVDGSVFDSRIFRRCDTATDTRMRQRAFDLRGVGVGGGHNVEKFREPDRRLTVSGAAVPGAGARRASRTARVDSAAGAARWLPKRTGGGR